MSTFEFDDTQQFDIPPSTDYPHLSDSYEQPGDSDTSHVDCSIIGTGSLMAAVHSEPTKYAADSATLEVVDAPDPLAEPPETAEHIMNVSTSDDVPPARQRIRVVGPYRDSLTPPEVATHLTVYERARLRPVIGGETLTESEMQTVQDVQDALPRIGARLGVSLDDRVPPEADYHLFNCQSDYDTAVQRAERPHLARASRGVAHLDLGVLWVRTGNQVQDQSGLAHETSHIVSNTRIAPHPNMSTGLIDIGGKVGYATVSQSLNEVVTDIMAYEVAKLAGWKAAAFQYAHHDLIGEALIRETASHAGTTPQDVADLLMRGMLNGDMTGLRLVGQALGPARMWGFMNMPDQLDAAGAVQVATSLDLPEKEIQRIHDFNAKRPVRFFDW